jgi:DNA-binding NarL/FixJ family response regulator
VDAPDDGGTAAKDLGARMGSFDTSQGSGWCSKRLVIVADNSLIVEAIRIGFRHSGEFKLIGHADGRRTSAATVLAAAPDVILFDDMDCSEQALELIRELRSQGGAVTLIALTLQTQPAWLDRLFDAGATGVISKTTRPVALATLVRETMNGNIYHRPAQASRASEPASSVTPGEDLPLTARELEILKLVAAGFTNGDIARRLWVTEQTVKFHLRNVYRKLGVSNRTQASHIAYVKRLVVPGATSAAVAGSKPAVTEPELTIAS